MIKIGFKLENAPIEDFKGVKWSKESKKEDDAERAESDDLGLVFDHAATIQQRPCCVANFCKKQHLQYIAHIIWLENDSL